MMKDKEAHSSAPFNMALATLERIDIILRALHDSKSPYYRMDSLNSLFLELAPFLNEAERNEGINRLSELNGQINVEGSTCTYPSKLPVRQYNLELWLRDKLYKHGLLMNKGDDPNAALGGGWS